MKYGNCLLYALMRWVVEGGRIELAWTSVKLRLPRFWHISRDGVKTRFAPVRPRNGLAALGHKTFFKGKVVTHDKAQQDRRRGGQRRSY